MGFFVKFIRTSVSFPPTGTKVRENASTLINTLNNSALVRILLKIVDENRAFKNVYFELKPELNDKKKEKKKIPRKFKMMTKINHNAVGNF